MFQNSSINKIYCPGDGIGIRVGLRSQILGVRLSSGAPIKLAIMIKINSDRSCGECTMCCQGHLTGSAHGFEFGPNKPCHWIRDSGCGIYPYRPDTPCKSFKCEWKVNKEIPEEFRPDKCKAIFVKRPMSETESRLDVVESGDVLSADVLHLIMILFQSHKYDHVQYQRGGAWYELKR